MAGVIDSPFLLWSTYLRDSLIPKPVTPPKERLPDLSNQTWVVTGATSDIGLELAKMLVKQNARVWLVGRNETKLEAALKALRQLKPATSVDSTKVDYNDLTTVKPGLNKILRSTTQLHGIIHNASVMNASGASKTAQGYEQHLGINNLATQLVQDLLDPLIENTLGGRIIWLYALGHPIAPKDGFNFAETESYSTLTRYAQSKALSYIQAVQWSRKHPNSRVKTLSAHPGTIEAGPKFVNGRTISWLAPYVEPDLEYGTYAPIYAAMSPYAATNDHPIPWDRPGDVRPDIFEAARGQLGDQADQWIEEQIKPFK